MAGYDKDKKNKNNPSEKEYSFFLILPIIAVLAVIPLITRYYQYNTHLGDFEWIGVEETQSDFFLHYKTVCLILVAVFMVLAIVYMVLGEERKFVWDKKLIPLAVYAGISLISAIASKNSYFSFNGIHEQFEPVWVLIGYFVITYYCFLSCKVKKQ